MLFIRLSIGQTVILGVKKENIAHILSISVSTCRCGDDGNHLRSSPLFYSFFPFKGGGVSNAFLLAFALFVFCFFFFFLPLVYSLFLAGKNTKRYHHHHIITIRTAARHIFFLVVVFFFFLQCE
jgi:hypothetical protein